MNDVMIERISQSAKALSLDLYARELAGYIDDRDLSEKELKAVCDVFEYLEKKKYESMVYTMLKLSKLPMTEPKTFEKFDFTRLHGKHVEVLKSLPMPAPLYARKNLAFIGPQGVGKTHLAMAFGRECCLKGFKTYFLKAGELNLKFTDARKNGREATVINGLVKPSCLIIDEVGRCVFDKANTRLFFDMIDRRYNKDGPCTMIFTSNKSPARWREFFSEDDTLLCSLDRIFDDATVFMMKGDSYRGKKLETLGIEAGIAKHTEYKNT